MTAARCEIAALCGGVGGAKLALGLQSLAADALTVVVNTGDDFEHLGLAICPDLDTVLYTLGGVADRERGWGRAGETWKCLAALAELGAETWFRLGDADLATHLVRTHALAGGGTLSGVTAALAAALGVRARIVPMSDDTVRTIVATAAGELPFQRYFVGERCEPRVTGLRYDGAARAAPAPGVLAALDSAALAAVVVCPSNPYLSIDPILAVPGIRERLARTAVRVVAVSPIVGGKAVKGPAAKIMAELGVAASSRSIAEHYRGLLDGLVIDTADAGEREAIEELGLSVLVTGTLMRDHDDRARLAAETLDFATGCVGNRKAGAT